MIYAVCRDCVHCLINADGDGFKCGVIDSYPDITTVSASECQHITRDEWNEKYVFSRTRRKHE